MSLAARIAARMMGRRNPSTLSKSSPSPRPTPARVIPPKTFAVLDDLAPFEWPASTPQPPAAPPPRDIRPGWRGACQALCAATGRRCRLPEHRVDEPHRHERGPFTLTAAPGQPLTARDELDRAATSRTFNPITET